MTDFGPFADMLESGDVPIFGFRVLVRMESDGTEHVDFAWTGERVRNYLAIGALEAAKIEFVPRRVARGDIVTEESKRRSDRGGTGEQDASLPSLLEARALQSRDWRFVRTRGGRTIHEARCSRAKSGLPWKWAEGRSVFDIMLTAIGCEWASCCCGFIYADALLVKEALN